jgi:hypothetical protein
MPRAYRRRGRPPDRLYHDAVRATGSPRWLRLAILAVAILAVAIAACRDEPAPRREAAQERAARMLREAAACESGPAAARTGACLAACELGHSNSCHGAGALSGDPAAALALHDRACDGGSGLGCAAAGLARRVSDPAEAERRDRMARFYLRVHCEQRHAPSCLALGRLYTTARGGPADAGASATFMSQACSLGLAEACGPSAPSAPSAPAPSASPPPAPF